MTISDNGDEYRKNLEAEKLIESKKVKAKWRELAAQSLGGYRALDAFRMDKLRVTEFNRDAIGAADTFDPSKDNLYLYGPVGSGKSHIAVAGVFKFYNGRNGDISFCVNTVKPSALGREIRSADGASEETVIIKRIRESDVLIIDDLGVEKDSEFMVNILYEIIDWRYMNRPGGLIVTSNLSLGALAKKLGDDRIPSRLRQMCKGFSLNGEKDNRLASA